MLFSKELLSTDSVREIEEKLLLAYRFSCKRNGGISINTRVAPNRHGMLGTVLIEARLTETPGGSRITYRSRPPYSILGTLAAILITGLVFWIRCAMGMVSMQFCIWLTLFFLVLCSNTAWQLKVCTNRFKELLTE